MPFQCRRDQNVHRGGPEGVFIDLLGARETGNLLFLRLPGGEGGHINPAFVIQGRGMILNDHHAGADAGEQAGCFATDVTKALQRDFGAFNFDTGATSHFPAGDKYATPGGLFTAEGAAEVDRFAGDHAGNGGAMVHGVGVHHPCHHFTVGADVRRRNIFLRPDNNADFAGVAAGQTLQFTF